MEKYEELEEIIEVAHDNIRQITAIKDGQVVFELCRYGYKPTDTCNVMSVTKSVTSLLCGIALYKGLIKSVDDPVLDYFPDYKVKRGEKTINSVTLRHLLTMTAPYKYKSEPWTKVCTSDDWTKAALDLLGGKAGITGDFKYSTLGIQILNGVISNASGMSALVFANEYLFSPLGIASRKAADAHTKEEQFEFLMSKEPKGEVWFSDPTGAPTAGWGLALSAGDMAKIGYMCQSGGIYNGARIVDEEWIRQMSMPYYRCEERFGNMSYGFLWWIIDEEKHIYAAIGDGGNIIYVDPSINAAVALTATFKPRVFNRV